MKRLPLVIIVLIAIVALAAADYFVNAPLENLPTFKSQPADDIQIGASYSNITQMLIDSNTTEFNYVITKRDRTKQIFEKFDMRSLENSVIFKNVLDKQEGEDTGDQIVIYEIQGPQNQGRITYLNLKLKLIDQMGAAGSVNEISGYGYNSFFYNDKNNENNGFLVSQIKDDLFGFQYNKKEDDGNFEIIKLMIDALNHLNLLT
jgi:hypothetical protein